MLRGLVALSLLLLVACGRSPCGPATGVVTSVIDGDTIRLESGETIRYLLVDTPEVTHGKNDCFGPEAKDFNTQLVLGKTVSLWYPEGECHDRYERSLA